MQIVTGDLVDRRNDAALFTLTRLVFVTPVKDGRAKSGWTTTINFIATVDRGNGQQNVALSEGASVIARSESDPYATIYISNGLPYIKKLNAGSSDQAPADFVGIVFNDVRVRFS